MIAFAQAGALLAQAANCPWSCVIAKHLYNLPAPTTTWASIVGSLAWPLTVLVIFFACRRHILTGLSHLASRFENDDLKFGKLFEITQKTDVRKVTLNDNWDVALFSFFSGGPENKKTLELWVKENVDDSLALSDFLTDDSHDQDRRKAYEHLKSKGLVDG